MEAVRSEQPAALDAGDLRGDRETQHDVLAALSECRNHRKWFAGFAKPYLGEHPIEIGSGFGDYAEEWIPFVDKYTATEADPALFPGLQQQMAKYPNVTVSQMMLPGWPLRRARWSWVILPCVRNRLSLR